MDTLLEELCLMSPPAIICFGSPASNQSYPIMGLQLAYQNATRSKSENIGTNIF